jgi:hypothetical protein
MAFQRVDFYLLKNGTPLIQDGHFGIIAGFSGEIQVFQCAFVVVIPECIGNDFAMFVDVGLDRPPCVGLNDEEECRKHRTTD